ncbi:hypothetical protein DPMN_061133 [Dreissena polymorpha]|uniref:Uncharacterized protein n=2 Tax=Dreissena polymorpha TaxID=45954 RepID=A0A9D4C6W1_DREPO|nr:hypothetical protein DPMN_061133 [Dreissena polymorpha]
MRHMVQFPDFFVKEKRDVFQKGEPEPLRREETTLSQMVDHMRGSKSHRNLLAGMEPLTYIRRTDGYAAAEKVVHEKMVDICIIEEGEVISDFELLLGLEMNMFSVVCQTACTFFHLESKIFDRLIYKRSPHTLTMMKFLAERKLTRRIRSQQGQRMPILAPLLLKILDVRVVDPSEENKEGFEKLTLPTAKTIILPKTPMAQRQPKRSKTVLFDWFVQGKTPLLQPIDKDAIYYREMIQKRAQTREMLRKRNDQQEVKSLGRRIRDTYWFNLKEKKKAMNTMKRLKLEHSEVTQAERWK